MQNLIFTGRFQPLHLGHIETIRTIKRTFPEDKLIICILRNSASEQVLENSAKFYKFISQKQGAKNNPLPNWQRFMLMSIAINSDEELKNNTHIIFRNRPDTWEDSLLDLPQDRVFVFPLNAKEPFDREKYSFYQQKKEKVLFLDVQQPFSSTEIRQHLKEEGQSYVSFFLPKACHEYFIEECLKYIID